MIYETFRQALKNIWSNKFRTLLTMLGIIIGILAVIVIVGLGNGMTASMKDSFSFMGTNTLTVTIMSYGSRMVSFEDVFTIVEENPEPVSYTNPTLPTTAAVHISWVAVIIYTTKIPNKMY